MTATSPHDTTAAYALLSSELLTLHTYLKAVDYYASVDRSIIASEQDALLLNEAVDQANSNRTSAHETSENARAKLRVARETHSELLQWIHRTGRLDTSLPSDYQAADQLFAATMEATKKAEATCQAADKQATQAAEALDTLRTKAAKGPQAITRRRVSLPEPLRDLPLSQLAAIATVAQVDPKTDCWTCNWAAKKGVELPPTPRHIEAAIVRGEIPYEGAPADGAGDGFDSLGRCICTYHHPTEPITLHMTWDTLDLDDLMVARTAHSSTHIDQVIPRSHRCLKLHSLLPWSPNPLKASTQTKCIEASKKLPDDIRGWLLLGPAGTSKTAFVAAWLTDAITMRLAASQRNFGLEGDHQLCVWRARADQWLDDQMAWETRDWQDDSVKRPSLTVATIGDACMEAQLPPILWLEELDKVSWTEKRQKTLNSLINTIYEEEGLIIVTSNLTAPELQKRVDPSTLRRITGINDDPARFQTWDFYEALKADKNR